MKDGSGRHSPAPERTRDADTGHKIGQPVALWFEVAGAHIQLFRPVVYRYVDKVLGERTQPFTVVPPVSVSFTESTILFPSDTPRDVTITVQAYSNPAKGSASFESARGLDVGS